MRPSTTSDFPNAVPGPLVMIVEPNSFMAELERAILKPYQVEFVRPEELVSQASSRKPALVISEIILRGADGLQLCRRIKESPATRSIPVLLFSVLHAPVEAAEAGADSFLLKPAERGSLAAEAKRLMKRPAGPATPPS